MELELGLTRSLTNKIELLRKDPNDFLNFKFVGHISGEESHLNEYKYIDFIIGSAEETLPPKCSFVEKFSEEKILQNIVFTNKERVKFYNGTFTNITFANCVFASQIDFAELPNNCHIVFQDCIIFEYKTIFKKPIEYLLFQNCIIKKLAITHSNFTTLLVGNSEILDLGISYISAKMVSTSHNNIHQIFIGPIKCDDFNLSINQCIYLRKSITIGNLKRTIMTEGINNSSILSTLEFIEKDSEIKINPVILTKIEYLKINCLKNGILNKIIRVFFGYFLFPGRIILSCIGIIILFAILLYYTTNINSFGNGFVLFDLDEIIRYLYLSLDSFLGAKIESKDTLIIIMNYLERMFGFLFPTAFTIALAKKYVK
ncbi:hypothetical protein AGMMS50212_09850 [Spirochaetia bacterium]|nr:hypothetical protein AGMMS50212_09850 [Spirochaetia bacterium]